jgi:protein ImuB
MARRVMSIWLPRLPLDRLVRREDPRLDGVFAITREIKNAKRLTHITDAGLRAGLAAGMSATDARALCPDLLTEPADLVREEALLRALRRWADHLSPWTALDGCDGLALDISGCAHLYGGEAAMREAAIGQLADMRIRSNIAIADTQGAAWALARYSHGDFIAAPGQTSAAVHALEVEALRIEPAIAISLRRVGLQSIGALSRIKTADLAKRYGLAFSQRLAKVLGHIPDPVAPMAADPVFAARMNLPEPIGLQKDVLAVLERLCTSVCGRLEKACMGARRFELTVRCVDTGDHVLPIGFARPSRDQTPILRQFERPLSDLRMKFGADWFRLVAQDVEPLVPVQRHISGKDDVEDGLDKVITTLGNRLGFDRVRRFVPCDSHIPEREFRDIDAVHARGRPDWPKPTRPRPLRLFRPERLRTLEAGRPPKRFSWRGASYETRGADGPERLSPEWWQPRSEPVRDYWRVQTGEGPRLWLMSYPAASPPEWFVAGKFP